jgi:hypothetical protein
MRLMSHIWPVLGLYIGALFTVCFRSHDLFIKKLLYKSEI